MSKLTNVVKKGTLWSILLAFILAAGLIIGIIFGMNTPSQMKDSATLTVTVDKYTYTERLADIEKDCQSAFDKNGLKTSKAVYGETNGVDVEIVYVFEKDSDLTAVKTALKETFDAKTKEGGEWAGASVSVMTANEDIQAIVAKDYALRGAIAAAVAIALVVGYIAIRYRWDMGALVGISMLATLLLTTALVAIIRVPVANSLAYVVLLSGLLAAVMSMFTINNMRDKKLGANEEEIANSVAVKEILLLGGAVVIGLISLMVAGLIAGKALVSFSLCGIIGVVAATAISLVYAPSVYLPFKKIADKKEENKGKRYVGAKKANDEE